MPRGDGTGPRGVGAGMGRGLGGCTVRDARAARESGVPTDRGFLRRITDSGSGSADGLTGRGKGSGMTIRDVLFSWLERISRK